jgi:hypothetical protein
VIAGCGGREAAGGHQGRLTVVDRCSINANAEKRGGDEKEVSCGSIEEGSWEMKRTSDSTGAL